MDCGPHAEACRVAVADGHWTPQGLQEDSLTLAFPSYRWAAGPSVKALAAQQRKYVFGKKLTKSNPTGL